MTRSAVYDGAVDAWQYLLTKGGIELAGRDEGLDERLRHRLAPTSASLEEALEHATLNAFLCAFLECVGPFVDMLRDVLDMFAKAGARDGQNTLRLRVDDVDVDLHAFREWIATFEAVESLLEVRALESPWPLVRLLMEATGVHLGSRADGSWTPPVDVAEWLDAFQADAYAPLPPRFNPDVCGDLSEVAAVLQAAVGTLQRAELAPSGARDLADAINFQFDRT